MLKQSNLYEEYNIFLCNNIYILTWNEANGWNRTNNRELFKKANTFEDVKIVRHFLLDIYYMDSQPPHS